MKIRRNVHSGQWHSCTFVLQVGDVALIFGDCHGHPVKGRYYATVVEIMTPAKRWAFRRGGYLDWARQTARMRTARP